MDKEVQEMFKKKNKEILINNLKLDIDRNIEVLINTINNIFDKEFDTAIKNINLMYEDSYFDKSVKKVDKLLDDLKLNSYKLIEDKIIIKKEKLMDNVINLEFEKQQIEDYYSLVFETTQDVMDIFNSDEFDKLKKDVIKQFYKYSESKLNDASITNSRINDYITYRLFGKIQDRIKDEFLIRDNNLSNKGRESYDKYQELEMRTTNL